MEKLFKILHLKFSSSDKHFPYLSSETKKVILSKIKRRVTLTFIRYKENQF